MFRLGLLLALAGCGVNDEPPPPNVLMGTGCEGGDPRACYDLGNFRINQPMPDLPGARMAYSKACNVHHYEACHQLGMMVRDARGGPRDPKRAVELLGTACEGGILQACADVGVLYYDGVGTKPDPARAVVLFNPACQAEQPIALACARLGRAWADGLGVEEKDPVVARELLTKACDMNDPASCVELGRFLATLKKEGVADALTAYDKACGLDAKFGCFEYAGMIHEKTTPGASDAKAAQYYQKTCSVDPTRGCFEAAQILESGKAAGKKEEIESLYNVACEHGVAEACARRTLEE